MLRVLPAVSGNGPADVGLVGCKAAVGVAAHVARTALGAAGIHALALACWAVLLVHVEMLSTSRAADVFCRAGPGSNPGATP